MASLTAAAATAEIAADDSMIIAGGILPAYGTTQEAPLRASALLLQADAPVCLVSCDVLALPRDVCDAAARGISEACEVPAENVLLTATHTHHAPSTFTVHGYGRDDEFCRRIVEAAISAGRQAREKLALAEGKPNETEAELRYACGIEGTVGKNSRWFMDDGQITWCGYDESLMVRPSGPHDPDLPLLVLRRPGGQVVGGAFCHATHNIGTLTGAARSPGFFGLAAQELERQHGGPFLFLPGAFGSSHRFEDCPAPEAVIRVTAAANEALQRAQPALRGPVLALKRPFTCTRRQWDEAEEDAKVRRWCDRWCDAGSAREFARVFAAMRAEMAPAAGESFQTWLQVIRLGDVAIVGVPGEMFGALGLEIRRRSPFGHTMVVGVANDEIGYIPNRQGYADGGYQTWVGRHCVVAPGTGEEMVEAALGMLQGAHDGPVEGPVMDDLRAGDAEALQSFYNHLGRPARRLFRPLGWNASYADCARALAEIAAGRRIDLVLRQGERIVGWATLVSWHTDTPHLGVGVADDWCGQGWGRRLMEALISRARAAGKQALELIHVKDNVPAGTLYRKVGFVVTGEHRGPDGEDYWEMRLQL